MIFPKNLETGANRCKCNHCNRTTLRAPLARECDREQSREKHIKTETERESATERKQHCRYMQQVSTAHSSKSELSVAERAGERQRCLVVQLRLSRVQAETHQTSVQFSPRDGLIANGRIVAPSQRRATRHSRNSNSSSYL